MDDFAKEVITKMETCEKKEIGRAEKFALPARQSGLFHKTTH